MIRRKFPIKRSTGAPRARRSAPRRGPAGIPADEWRNPEYRRFLREAGRCVVCKGPDSGCIPLCRVHHDEQHRLTWPVFEARYGFNREREAAVWWAAYNIWKEANG